MISDVPASTKSIFPISANCKKNFNFPVLTKPVKLSFSGRFGFWYENLVFWLILLRFEEIIIRNKRDDKFCARLRNNERFFSFFRERGTKKKFWVPMRNRTSDLRITRSMPYHWATEMVSFELGKGWLRIFSLSHARDKTKNIFQNYN